MTFWHESYIIGRPDEYVRDIFDIGFIDVQDGDSVFKNIQPRPFDDEFGQLISKVFEGYEIVYNFVRMSPAFQKEPNFIHSDEMMGDITVILYLSKNYPEDDGTIFYDNNDKPIFRVYSKFNTAIAFDSRIRHSRSLYHNFGEGDTSRLIQVAFLKQKHE